MDGGISHIPPSPQPTPPRIVHSTSPRIVHSTSPCIVHSTSSRITWYTQYRVVHTLHSPVLNTMLLPILFTAHSTPHCMCIVHSIVSVLCAGTVRLYIWALLYQLWPHFSAHLTSQLLNPSAIIMPRLLWLDRQGTPYSLLLLYKLSCS